MPSSRFFGFLAIILFLPTTYASNVNQGYDLDKAKISDRGKVRDIVQGKPSYGRIYTSSDGTYTFMLVRDWVVRREKNGIYFFGSSSKGNITCVVRTMSYQSGRTSFRDMQGAPEGPIRSALEREMLEHGGERILSRDVFYLGGKKYRNLAPVKMLNWNIKMRKQNLVWAAGAVETPAVTLELLCGGRPEVLPQSQNMIRNAFRLAEGAMMSRATSATSGSEGRFVQGVRAYNSGNYHQAYNLWKPLADKGYAPAQYNIGVLYQKGYGVSLDNLQANHWWRKSANQNYPLAQSSLGLSYAIGRGVVRDYVKAYMWISIAAKGGDAIAKQALLKLENSMTEAQLFNGGNKVSICERQLKRKLTCE